MDNQHTLTADLAWVGGIIDGEGSINCSFSKFNKRKRFRACPQLKMGNTDQIIIREYTKILDNFGIRYNLFKQIPKNQNSKIATIVKISRMDMLEKFLPIIIPYLRGKKSRALLLQDLVKSRRNKMGKCPRFYPYDDKEIEIINQLGVINKKGCQRLNAIQEEIPVSDSPLHNESCG